MTNRGFVLKEDEHFNEEGYPVCNKCGTLRVLIHPSFSITPRCACKCQEEEAERQRALEKKKQKYERLMQAQTFSPLRKNFENAIFENTDLKGKDRSFITAYNRSKKYCENAAEIYKEGYGIYFQSVNPGVGKTHLMSCIARELNSKYISTLLINEGDILRVFKETFKNSATEKEVLDRITNIEFLMIDDIGTESYNYGDNQKWIQQKMYDIVDRRYNSGKPTLFSSNYSIPELSSKAGLMDKTVDRIYALSTVVLEIKGGSNRQPKQQNLF